MEDTFFIASKLFWIVAQPGNLIAILIVISSVTGFAATRRRWLKSVNALLLVMTLSFTTLPVSDWISAPLERRFPQPDITTTPLKPKGVIVLGGVIDPIATTVSGMPSIGGGAERVLEMLYLARLYPDVPVIYTGGSGRLTETEYREADAARVLIGRIGLDPDRFIFESNARNTFENATRVAELKSPEPDDLWILVTSAAHMPRAVGVFRRVGFKVMPYPVDYKTNLKSTFSFQFDLGGGLSGISGAIKEWVGLAAYRLMGRTTELFPAPDQ